jgi:hypothetical protein
VPCSTLTDYGLGISDFRYSIFDFSIFGFGFRFSSFSFRFSNHHVLTWSSSSLRLPLPASYLLRPFVHIHIWIFVYYHICLWPFGHLTFDIWPFGGLDPNGRAMEPGTMDHVCSDRSCQIWRWWELRMCVIGELMTGTDVIECPYAPYALYECECKCEGTSYALVLVLVWWPYSRISIRRSGVRGGPGPLDALDSMIQWFKESECLECPDSVDEGEGAG